MPSLSAKERKAKFNANDLIFRKKFNLPFGTLLSAESLTNKWKQTLNFSNIPNKPFPLTLSKKCLMIKEFKNELKSLKNLFNEIKKTRIIKRTRGKRKMKQKESYIC